MAKPSVEAPDAASEIATLEARSGARIGVAAYDTGSGRQFAYRANERFPMCSTFKFLAVAAILQQVDAGHDQLNRFVPYQEADLLVWSPVTRANLGKGGMTLGDLCAAAIEQSDNTAGNLLLNAIGGPAGLTSFVRTLGDQTTRLDRIEPELNTALPGDERDTTSPAAIEGDLATLLTTNILSARSRNRLEAWLGASVTGEEMIRAGVPKTWKVGDKTGRGDNGAINDVAILRPPGRAPIFLAIYSIVPPSAGRGAAPIEKIARAVLESL